MNTYIFLIGSLIAILIFILLSIPFISKEYASNLSIEQLNSIRLKKSKKLKARLNRKIQYFNYKYNKYENSRNLYLSLKLIAERSYREIEALEKKNQQMKDLKKLEEINKEDKN